MRTIGLVGSGHWAGTVHARSIAVRDDVEFAGIWARNDAERDRLAGEFGVRSFESAAELFAAVDIVDFAIPPAPQSELAVRAAQAGKHLLLEKPAALTVDRARALSAAVAEAGVCAVVFLTRLFEPHRAAWLDDRACDEWTSAHAEWLSAALSSGSPIADSTWRQDGGALWDVGPHILSQLERVLGPVVSGFVVSHERGGTTELLLSHHGGATSSVRMTVHGDPAQKTEWIEFAGTRGTVRSDNHPLDFLAAHGRALDTLLAQIDAPGGRARRDPGRDPDPAPAYSVDSAVRMTAVLHDLDALTAQGAGGQFQPVGRVS